MAETDRGPLIAELARAAGAVIAPERLEEAARIAAANVALLRSETASQEFGRQPSEFVRVLRAGRDE